MKREKMYRWIGKRKFKGIFIETASLKFVVPVTKYRFPIIYLTVLIYLESHAFIETSTQNLQYDATKISSQLLFP